MGWSQFSLKASVLCCCGLVMVIFVDGSLTKCTSLKGNVEDCANRGFTHIPTHFDFLSLNLEQNAITTLLADQFIRYPFLQSMNLQSNFIAEIETGALNGLSDLKVLNLSSNRLEHLPGYIFSPLRSLLHLDLSRNALRAISSEAFANLWSLQTLSLSDNRITNLDKVRFIDLQNLTTLRLERNELITLDNSVTASLPQLSFLFLQDNPLQCSCSLQSLLIWSAGSGRFLHGADCATPPSLSGRNLKELLELDLTCIAPRIDSVKVSDRIVVEGDTITFSCSATGYPKPVIYWTNPEGVILWPDGDHNHNKPYKSHENGTSR
ncbi:leucine-rich repeat and fibronectin type-III domain-containing protein 5-like [Ptychodera flava]|uniref:leucine-rich repeat and fibronectin type-III domain-containing protein 5-like n=1 Tax=Ptychodera flava TaxID=63121 RepID=UPI003969BC89